MSCFFHKIPRAYQNRLLLRVLREVGVITNRRKATLIQKADHVKAFFFFFLFSGGGGFGLGGC